MGEEQLRLDEIDRKIISCLFEDSRRNLSGIGKEIGLSKNAIWTRYKLLCNRGVITGSTVQINYKKLGYDAVGQLLLAVEPSKVEQVANYIKAKIPDVFGPYISASRYNVRAIVTLKTVGELEALKDDLRRKLPIIELQCMIWTDVWFKPESLTLLSVKRYEEPNNLTIERIINLDNTDLDIIRQLAINSRVAFRTLANKIGLSTDTIVRRYQKLREKGIIIPRIQINPTKIGYYALLTYFLRVNQGQDMESIVSRIVSIPDLFYLMRCTGDFQLSVILGIKDLNQVIEMGNYISKIEGLRLIDTSINPLAQKWPGSRTYTSTC
jgi:DNA-binding Lrp family transcriptional regulator